jgi:DNA-binding beta-propeller fold protein YncE
LAFAAKVGERQNQDSPKAEVVDRSPVDLAVSPDESWLVTANQTSDSVSLVRIADGAVLDEVSVGRRPVAISLCPDGRRGVVSCNYSGQLQLFEVKDEQLKIAASIQTGFQPYDVTISADGRTAYVALAAAAEVAVVDLEQQKVIDRIEVGPWPRYLALSPDGKTLAVNSNGDAAIWVIDTSTREVRFKNGIYGLNLGQMQISPDGQHVYFPWMLYRDNPISAGTIRAGWVLGGRLSRVRLDKKVRRDAIAMDPPGKAVGDLHGLALTSDGEQIVIGVAGTHELLVLRANELPYFDDGGPDRMDGRLVGDSRRFFRVELGGRPMGLQIQKDDRHVLVANYLLNSVQVVDLDERRLVREIPLGGPAEPSLARQGEAIFYDAGRSLDQWYSCHSCHYDGGTNREPLDTHNDGSTFTYKTVAPLYNVHETGPWTWHGWQTDLQAAMKKSLTSTMLGPEPSDHDVQALLAYLQTLEPPPNPHREADGSLSAAAQRGEAIFNSDKANCASCHTGPYFTDGEIHNVGTASAKDRYEGYNTPSLIGVYRKVRFLHDGRARSLEKALMFSHSPEKVSGTEELNESEIADLVAYLKSL